MNRIKQEFVLTINKYWVLIALFSIVAINPALIEEIMKCFSGRKPLLSFGIVLVALIISSFDLVMMTRLKALFDVNTRKWLLICIVLLAARCGFKDDAYIAPAIIGVMLLSIYISVNNYSKRGYILSGGVILLSLIGTIIYHEYINDFLFAVIVIILLWNTDDDICLSKGDCSVVRGAILIWILGAALVYSEEYETLENSSMSWQLFNDYFNFGFVTRGLMATINYILSFGRVTMMSTHIFIVGFHLSAMVIILGCIWILLRQGTNKERFWIMILICSEPFRRLGDADNYIYFESIMIAIIFVSLLVFKYKKGFVCLPFLCAIGMCIHHIFALSFLPVIIFGMLIYIISDTYNRKKYTVILSIICFTCLVLFTYFHFFSRMFITADYQTMCQYVADVLGKQLSDNLLNMNMQEVLDNYGYLYVNIHYVLFGGHSKNYGIQSVKYSTVIYSLVIVFLSLCLYVTTVKEYLEDEAFKNNKILVKVIAISFVVVYLIQYFEVDYGRWNSALILYLIIINIYRLWADFNVNNKSVDRYDYMFLAFSILIPNMGAFCQ